MIHEVACLRIDPADAAAFEAAVAACIPLFRDAKGFRSFALGRTIEDPARYELRIGWDTVEDHMVAFRGSPAFADWRARVGGHFTHPPEVVHTACVCTAEPRPQD